MKNKLLYLSLMLILATAISCKEEAKEDITAKNKLESLAQKVLADSIARTFSLDTLTSYTWDKVYILTPYSQLDKAEDVAKADLSQLGKTGIESVDWKNVIAFISNGELVSYIDLPSHLNDFSYLSDSAMLQHYGKTEYKMFKKEGRAVVEKIKD
ncbi:hypothetical protein [Pontibacter rugosus]|uniref:Lipoprotein n=1 Tax=Pontibacter rugosus TaxID=1745966 RepID=A0ABW3SUI4_9BACT